MNEEILQKARAAKSPEELLKLAHENGMNDFIEENTKEYFEAMHKSGELSDDELENASGGCKTSGGRRIVSKGLVCPAYMINGSQWKCKVCHQSGWRCTCGKKDTAYLDTFLGVASDFTKSGICGTCEFCSYEVGVWYCNNDIANAN